MLVVFFVFKQYNIRFEEFINHLPISNTIKCFNDNENLQLFCDDMNVIFDKYKIETGEFEISTKFTKEDIEKYLDVTPNVDALIYLKVSPETIVGQLRLRDEVCQDFFEDIEHNSLILDSVIDKVRTTKVITVT